MQVHICVQGHMNCKHSVYLMVYHRVIQIPCSCQCGTCCMLRFWCIGFGGYS